MRISKYVEPQEYGTPTLIPCKIYVESKVVSSQKNHYRERGDSNKYRDIKDLFTPICDTQTLRTKLSF